MNFGIITSAWNFLVKLVQGNPEIAVSIIIASIIYMVFDYIWHQLQSRGEDMFSNSLKNGVIFLVILAIVLVTSKVIG